MEAEKRLSSEEGSYFVNLVLDKLTQRINILVQNDSEATTLVNMIRSLNYQVDIGHAAAERLLISLDPICAAIASPVIIVIPIHHVLLKAKVQ